LHSSTVFHILYEQEITDYWIHTQLMELKEICELLNIDPEGFTDLHITRNFSSFVAVSEGKVIAVTDPRMKHCPLFSMLYKKNMPSGTKGLKQAIQKAVESKIEQFGSFTPRRQLIRNDIAVPFGASEMMMYALREKNIDAAVTVCDGAGTVVANEPSLVQGIGARMNGLFYTTPIPEVISKIEHQGGKVVFPEHAQIDQIAGLKAAVRKGYKKIAVTINGFTNEDLSLIQKIEKDFSVTAVCIIVCTTGVTEERGDLIAQFSDLVWACGSASVRTKAGRVSILQITLAIPVFVLTEKGLNFVSSYCSDPDIITGLSPEKQYLIAKNAHGTPLTMGTYSAYLTESRLPVRSPREPK